MCPRDDRLVALEEVGHLGQGQPGRFALEADLDPSAAVLGLVKEELGSPAGNQAGVQPSAWKGSHAISRRAR